MSRWGPLPVEFWGRVQCAPGPACWEWQGTLDRHGYGRYSLKKATHVAWLLATGAWPTRHILHRCDNPGCVRFAHLFEGSQADNNHDAWAKGRAHVLPPLPGEQHPSYKHGRYVDQKRITPRKKQ